MQTALSAAPQFDVGRYLEMIRQLPQSEFIQEDRKLAWVEAILSFEPERIEWHIKRLSGIGGSEIGTVVAPFAGEYDPFSQPRDVYMDKMMITLPEPPNGHMRRGTFMEDTIRDAFRAKFQMVPDEDALKALEGYRDPNHPWRVGNPDDYGLIGGRRWMVDYKCPMPGFKDKYNKYGISFGYKAQLHHYTAMARQKNIQVDGLLLCSWDMEKWEPDVRMVEMDNALFRHMEEAGDWLWHDCILRGQIPEAARQETITIEGNSDDEKRLRHLLDSQARIGILSSRAYAMQKEIANEIRELMAGRRLENKKITYNVMTITAEPEVNGERLEKLMHQHRLNPKDFIKQGKLQDDLVLQKAIEAKLDLTDCYAQEFDIDSLRTVFDSLGVPEHQYLDEKVSPALSRAKKGLVGDQINDLKELAGKTILSFGDNPEGPSKPRTPTP